MGRRNRQRAKLAVPVTDYPDADGNVLRLRGALSAGSRREYSETLQGGLNRDDARQRALELLFERLAVAWQIAGVPTTGSRELLTRYRLATAAERDFVRDALRAHAQENFPELETP
ncbi:MAG TPA: hypothetical protein VFN55_01010 [Solirubrobacteraceae bacterium]|nr:hypothetical protein [Solirubrobacteraceae bacterium]